MTQSFSELQPLARSGTQRQRLRAHGPLCLFSQLQPAHSQREPKRLCRDPQMRERHHLLVPGTSLRRRRPPQSTEKIGGARQAERAVPCGQARAAAVAGAAAAADARESVAACGLSRCMREAAKVRSMWDHPGRFILCCDLASRSRALSTGCNSRRDSRCTGLTRAPFGSEKDAGTRAELFSRMRHFLDAGVRQRLCICTCLLIVG